MDIVSNLTLLLAGGALVLPGIHFAFRDSVPDRKLAGYVAVAILVISSLLVAFSATRALEPPLAPGLFRADLLGVFFALAVLLVSTFVAIASLQYVERDPNSGVYYSLLVFTALGMVLLSFAVDLLMIFVAWELMSLPTYVLAGFSKRDPSSNEASIKYFLVGALGSGLLLYAISLTYGLVGSTGLAETFSALGKIISDKELAPLAILSLALFIGGFGFKMAIVPFHMWIPDAYQGAPTTVSTLLAAGTKKAGFVAAIRVLVIAMTALKADWTLTLAVLAVFTMTLGNVAALTQRSITRLLAYSSIAQAGFIVIGLAVAPATATSGLGLTGALFHVFNHAIMKSAAFIAAAIVIFKTGREDLANFNGLGRRMPFTAFALTISMLALAGMPPLSGFWSKLVLFTAAIEGGMSWLAVAGILNSVFSLGYYGWLIKRMYLDDFQGATRIQEPVSLSLALGMGLALIFVIGVYPTPIIEFARSAVLGAT